MTITSININDSQKSVNISSQMHVMTRAKMSKKSLTPKHMREVFPRKKGPENKHAKAKARKSNKQRGR
jgi:hypothetical protein